MSRCPITTSAQTTPRLSIRATPTPASSRPARASWCASWRRRDAALLATLMLIKAEALEQLGNPTAAAALRMDSAAWARYGFGPDSVVKARMRDIAAVADRAAKG